MSKRFFVIINARDQQALEDLFEMDLDLIHGVGPKRRRGGKIEALVSLDEIELLSEEGFEVTVVEPSEKRSRARDTIQFKDWLEKI